MKGCLWGVCLLIVGINYWGCGVGSLVSLSLIEGIMGEGVSLVSVLIVVINWGWGWSGEFIIQ